MGRALPRLATDSTPQEWAAAGFDHFENKRYQSAMHCYERALKMRERDVSYAFLLREQARETSNERSRLHAFAKAADAFCKSAQAAMIEGRPETETRAYYHNAALCYSDSNNLIEAAECYAGAHAFSESARCYCRLSMYSRAARIIREHGPVARDVLSDVALHYFRKSEEKFVSYYYPRVRQRADENLTEPQFRCFLPLKMQCRL